MKARENNKERKQKSLYQKNHKNEEKDLKTYGLVEKNNFQT